MAQGPSYLSHLVSAIRKASHSTYCSLVSAAAEAVRLAMKILCLKGISSGEDTACIGYGNWGTQCLWESHTQMTVNIT